MKKTKPACELQTHDRINFRVTNHRNRSIPMTDGVYTIHHEHPFVHIRTFAGHRLTFNATDDVELAETTPQEPMVRFGHSTGLRVRGVGVE